MEYTYFFSDVHLGLNRRENWYQKTRHEKYLQAILSYIIKKGDAVGDVVMLGDWFDAWEYESRFSIPGPEQFVAECINEHGSLFTKGENKDFLSLINGIHGDFWYINGNHDMTISVDAVNKALGLDTCSKYIRGNPDPLQNTKYQSRDKNIYAEHGHRYSLMCRCDSLDNKKANPYYPIPLGYYVSRIAGDYGTKQLIGKPDTDTVADLPDSGNPALKNIISGISPESFQDCFGAALQSVFIKGTIGNDANETDAYQDYLNHNYIMPDGKKVSAKEAAGYYPWMHTKDIINPLKSKDAQDFWNVDLDNCLDDKGKDCCGKNAIVVFGHTHKPVLTAYNSHLYVNSGYLCPSIYDVTHDNKAAFSFVEIAKENKQYTVTILQCDYKTLEISPLRLSDGIASARISLP